MSDTALTPLQSRALAAYGRSNPVYIPSKLLELTVEGRRYVVLVAGPGILAVYRVRNDDQLKRLRRWPEAIDAKFGADSDAVFEPEC